MKFNSKSIINRLGLNNSSKMSRAGIKYGSDKLTHHGYERFYDYFLQRFKRKRINFLEIGVEDGSSIKMWKKYFSRAKIYGMDIDHEYSHSRGKVFKGDQSKIADLKKVASQIRQCDFIIDDGSHVPEHQLLTFNYFFDKLLNQGGVYIIEDIETSYWINTPQYGYTINAGYNKKNNIVEIFKQISDVVNREFLFPEDLKRLNKVSQVSLNNLKYISSIMFGQNCIIINKMSKEEYRKYGKRKYRFNQRMQKSFNR